MAEADPRPCLKCDQPRAKGQSHCRPHANEMSKAWYHEHRQQRIEAAQESRRLARGRWQQFCIALGMAAAYQTGYRDGLTDRAVKLLEQRHHAQGLERMRAHAAIHGSYLPGSPVTARIVRTASGHKVSPI